jgi:hypothetical protein
MSIFCEILQIYDIFLVWVGNLVFTIPVCSFELFLGFLLFLTTLYIFTLVGTRSCLVCISHLPCCELKTSSAHAVHQLQVLVLIGSGVSLRISSLFHLVAQRCNGPIPGGSTVWLLPRCQLDAGQTTTQIPSGL